MKVLPPSVLTCHCTLGAGPPLAAAVKVTVAPAFTVCEIGSVATAGADWTPGTMLTSTVATGLVVVPSLTTIEIAGSPDAEYGAL